jgi:hypothetical protein
MKTEISIPELGLVAITRALLGAGVAFVVADRLDTHQRKAVGWTLTAVGVLTTVPLLLDVFWNHDRVALRGSLNEPEDDLEDDVQLDSGNEPANEDVL